MPWCVPATEIAVEMNTTRAVGCCLFLVMVHGLSHEAMARWPDPISRDLDPPRALHLIAPPNWWAAHGLLPAHAQWIQANDQIPTDASPRRWVALCSLVWRRGDCAPGSPAGISPSTRRGGACQRAHRDAARPLAGACLVGGCVSSAGPSAGAGAGRGSSRAHASACARQIGHEFSQGPQLLALVSSAGRTCRWAPT